MFNYTRRVLALLILTLACPALAADDYDVGTFQEADLHMALAFPEDGSQIFSAVRNDEGVFIVRWSGQTGKREKVWPLEGVRYVRAMALGADSMRLGMLADSGKDPENSDLVGVLELASGNVSLARNETFSKGGKHYRFSRPRPSVVMTDSLVIASAPGDLLMYDIDKGEMVDDPVEDKYVSSLSLSDDGKKLAIGFAVSADAKENEAWVYLLPEMRRIMRTNAPYDGLAHHDKAKQNDTHVAFLPGQRWLVTTRRGEVHQVQAITGKRVKSFVPDRKIGVRQDQYVAAPIISADGAYVAQVTVARDRILVLNREKGTFRKYSSKGYPLVAVGGNLVCTHAPRGPTFHLLPTMEEVALPLPRHISGKGAGQAEQADAQGSDSAKAVEAAEEEDAPPTEDPAAAAERMNRNRERIAQIQPFVDKIRSDATDRWEIALGEKKDFRKAIPLIVQLEIPLSLHLQGDVKARDLKALSKADVWGLRFDDLDAKTVPPLDDFPNLTSLCFQDTPPSLATFRSMGGMKNLRYLTLREETSVGCFKLLAPLMSLERFECDGWELTNAHCRALPKLPAMEHLSLRKCPGVTDAGVQALADAETLPKVRRLDLRNSQITDEALRAMLKLPSLGYIDVRYNEGITEAGVEEAKKKLVGLTVMWTRPKNPHNEEPAPPRRGRPIRGRRPLVRPRRNR